MQRYLESRFGSVRAREIMAERPALPAPGWLDLQDPRHASLWVRFEILRDQARRGEQGAGWELIRREVRHRATRLGLLMEIDGLLDGWGRVPTRNGRVELLIRFQRALRRVMRRGADRPRSLVRFGLWALRSHSRAEVSEACSTGQLRPLLDTLERELADAGLPPELLALSLEPARRRAERGGDGVDLDGPDPWEIPGSLLSFLAGDNAEDPEGPHPDQPGLLRYSRWDTPMDLEVSVEAHLATCPACRQWIETLQLLVQITQNWYAWNCGRAYRAAARDPFRWISVILSEQGLDQHQFRDKLLAEFDFRLRKESRPLHYAEDLVHETLVSLAHTIHRYDEEKANLFTWCWSNHARNAWNRRFRPRDEEGLSAVEPRQNDDLGEPVRAPAERREKLERFELLLKRATLVNSPHMSLVFLMGLFCGWRPRGIVEELIDRSLLDLEGWVEDTLVNQGVAERLVRWALEPLRTQLTDEAAPTALRSCFAHPDDPKRCAKQVSDWIYTVTTALKREHEEVPVAS